MEDKREQRDGEIACMSCHHYFAPTQTKEHFGNRYCAVCLIEIRAEERAAAKPTNINYLKKVVEIQLGERADAERERHRPQPSPALQGMRNREQGTGGDPGKKGEHPVYRAEGERERLEVSEKIRSALHLSPITCPPHLLEEDDTPDEPVTCFTPDLRRDKEAAVVAKSLQTQLADARRLIAGIDHHQAEAAELLLREALTSVGALLLLLQDGGDQ